MTYKTTPETRAAVLRYQLENPFRVIWHNARARARKKGRKFDLTVADVEAVWPTDGRCPIFGVKMPLPGERQGVKRGPQRDSATLDRIDNAGGYVVGNVVIISWLANRIKTTATADEIAKVAAWLKPKEQLLSLL